MLLVVSAFRTDERSEIRGVISEFKFEIRLERVSVILGSTCKF